MKMVKSLLLGSAAGLVAVTAGQAADLPVKAQPVQYVKVCSLYGAGFYYMPGTDLCLKVGGWARAEAAWGTNGSVTWGPFNGQANTRATSNLVFRARGYITADAREQTAYGTARGYIAVGLSSNDVGLTAGANIVSINRAFVQWAGMTAGLAQSFYDFYSVPAAQYRGALPASDTGDSGWWVWGYTAQFGGGFSATLSMEARRTTQICDNNTVNSSTCTITPGGYINGTTGNASGSGIFPANGAYGGQQWGDIVGNLRVDQAWGAAQVMGAIHNVNASYYSPAPGAGPSILAGHPADATGFAVGGGLKVLFPSIAAGDYFQSQVNYTQGALRYLFMTPNTNWGKVDGAAEAYGVMSDCVYGGIVAAGTNTSCQLTTAWGFNASFEHYWTPSVHQSLYGAYYAVSYSGGAGGGNALLCTNEGFGIGTTGTGLTAAAGCNNNWSTWGIGSRLQWDVTKSFYLGVEVLYSQLISATTPTGALPALTTIAGSGATITEPSSTNWLFTLRAHKDFLP